MVITYENRELITTYLHCHDSYFDSFSADIEHHALSVILTKSWAGNIRKIQFTDVICCSITGFDPWGKGDGDRILAWQILTQEEAEAAFDGLIRHTDQEYSVDLSLLVCSEFLLCSGDRFRIACKSACVDLWEQEG